MMKALNDLCDEASTLETSYYMILFSAFIMPNHLLCKFPYFSLFFLIFHFRSIGIVTKFVVY